MMDVDYVRVYDGNRPHLAGDRKVGHQQSGAVYSVGGATYHGGVGATAGEPIAAIEAAGDGYWLTTTLGDDAFAPPIPANSGTGRRIVYSNSDQRVWLIEDGNDLVTSYLVSGKRNTPNPGVYSVFSKSRYAIAGHDGISMEYMVRFTHGRRLAIGFHSIPLYSNGEPMQTEDELGYFRSGGCVRQADDKALALYEWTPIRTTVIVLP